MDSAYRADLHLHTSASDGAVSPSGAVSYARAAGMALIAVTDHDTVAGLAEAMEAGAAAGMTVLPGIELTAGGEEEVHLLGYGLDPGSEALAAFLDRQMVSRRERLLAMLERLRAMGLSMPDMESARFPGRVPLARVMVALGYADTVKEAFDRYLDAGKPAYVPRGRLSVPDGIAALRSLGAVVALAHPGRLRMDVGTLTARLPGWMEAGLEALEAYHPSHRDPDKAAYERLARARGLLVTGGSDWHGPDHGGAGIGEHLRGWRAVREDVLALAERTNAKRMKT